MAGWLALAIFNDFGYEFGSLGDGLEMAGRWLGEHLLYYNTHFVLNKKQNNEYHQYNNTTIQYNHKQKEPDGWVVGFFEFQEQSDGNLNRRKMARRWLGGWPLLFPKIAGVIPDRCKIAGR